MYNPKITAFDLSELTMADSGEGSEFTFNYTYEGMYIEPNYDLTTNDNGYKLSELTSGGMFNINPTYGDGQPSTQGYASSQSSTSDVSDGFVDGLGNSLKSKVPGI